MARNKLSVEFTGYEVLKKQLDQIGGNATRRAIEGALKASQQVVAKKADTAMSKHIRTGTTKRAILKNGDVTWMGDIASIDVGFDIDNGGLPSIFLMYGTKLHGQPHITPDRELYNAVYGAKTRREVRSVQEDVLYKVIERSMRT